MLAVCAALCVGLVLRPWWQSRSLFVGTVVCAAAVAVLNVMMPSVIRRRFPNHMGEMTAAYTVAMSIGSAISAGLTVPMVMVLGGSVDLALAMWGLPAAVAFAMWLPQLRWPRPGERAAGSDIGMLHDLQAWQITLYFGLQAMLFYTLLSWLPTIYRDHGMSPTAAGGVLAVLTGVGIVGNVAAPLLANRFGRPTLAVLTTGGMTLVGLIGVIVAPTELALVWASLMGIGTGGTFSVTLLLMASRAHDTVIAARLSAMAQGIGYMISAAGPLLAGLLHSASGGWDIPVFAVIAVCVGMLAAGVGAARPGMIVR
jgi:CP family cyanate transporter-like MFS transporter